MSSMKWIAVTISMFEILGCNGAGSSNPPGDGFGGVAYGGGGAYAGAAGTPGNGGYTPGGGGYTPGGGGYTPGGGGYTPGGGGYTPGVGGAAGGGGFPPGSGGAAGAIGNGGAAGSVTAACAGQNFPPMPDDPSARGPWDVGVKTVTIGRLTVEIVYPAEPGSTAGVPEATYDIRAWLPKDQQAKVPDSHSPAVGPIGGHLFRDVPIDGGHGPYPVVIAIHGTASFRIASGSTGVQWASRGFVVVSADYPGLFLTDQLCATADCKPPSANASTSCGTVGTQDIPGDVTTQINALNSPSGQIAFLAGHIDMTRLGITGHSQGACVSAGLTNDPNVQIVLPMAGSLSVNPSSSLKSLIFIAGIADKVIGYNASQIGNLVCSPVAPEGPATSDTGAYQASPGPPVIKRLVGITGGGHLTVTDLCQTNAQGNNAIQEAQADGVCGISQAAIIGLPALFDCGTVSLTDGIHAVNYASTAALEETLHCADRSAAFANLTTAVPQIGDYQHSP